jgi:hypothetical protein
MAPIRWRHPGALGLRDVLGMRARNLVVKWRFAGACRVRLDGIIALMIARLQQQMWLEVASSIWEPLGGGLLPTAR